MPVRRRLELRHRKVPLGGLRHRLKLVSRSQKPPKANSPTGAGATFAKRRDVWAAIKTVGGVEFFDGHNIRRDVSHMIKVRFDKGTTAQTWVELRDGTRLDILEVEDLEERHEYHLLTCALRGSKTKAANSG